MQNQCGDVTMRVLEYESQRAQAGRPAKGELLEGSDLGKRSNSVFMCIATSSISLEGFAFQPEIREFIYSRDASF